MGSTGGTATQGLEDLQGGESERPGEEAPTDLEANTLRSLKHGTNIKRAISYSRYFKVVQVFTVVSAAAGSVAKPRDKLTNKKLFVL